LLNPARAPVVEGMALINHSRQLGRLRLLQQLAPGCSLRGYAADLGKTDMGNSAPSPGAGGQGAERTEESADYNANIIDNLKETQGKAGTAAGGTKGADVKSPLSAGAKGDAGDDRGSSHPDSKTTHNASSNANPKTTTFAEGDAGKGSTTEQVGAAQRARTQSPRNM